MPLLSLMVLARLRVSDAMVLVSLLSCFGRFCICCVVVFLFLFYFAVGGESMDAVLELWWGEEAEKCIHDVYL